MPFSDHTRPYVPRWFAASDGSDVLQISIGFVAGGGAKASGSEARSLCHLHSFRETFCTADLEGRYQLDVDFVETVQRVTSDSRAWFARASTVLDRLSTVRAIHLEHKGTLCDIKNTGDVAIDEHGRRSTLRG